MVMFHRVLERSDPRWPTCDPEYTLDADMFSQCLQFFARHYSIVSAQQVLQSRRGEATLPPRALLVTFDDGWADTFHVAWPRMRAAGVPGLLFVVADAIGRRAPFFQEQIVGAWRRGALDTAALARAARQWLPGLAMPHDNALPTLRRLVTQVEGLDAAARARLLDTLAPALADEHRHMLTAQELQALAREGMGIGLHGKTHTPLTAAPDLDAELAGARAQVAACLPPAPAPPTLSFPHGRHDAAVCQRAVQAGYELLFTSVPRLNPTRHGPGRLLGRLGIHAGTVADAQGRFRPEHLACRLFRAAIRAPN